jgi:hypothetical protein
MQTDHVSSERSHHGGVVAGRGAEKRSHPRIGLRLPIAFRAVTARPPVLQRGVTLDVSRSGVRFRSEGFLPVGEFVALEVSLPGRGTYAARGRAVWTRAARGDGHWVVGAEFLRSGGDADAALAEALLLSTENVR